jgi:hypothetical protein
LDLKAAEQRNATQVRRRSPAMGIIPKDEMPERLRCARARTQPSNLERPVMGSYDTVNLRAGINRGGLTADFHVKNVGNSYGFNRLTSEVIDGYSAPFAASVIQPRTFGISVSYKY